MQNEKLVSWQALVTVYTVTQQSVEGLVYLHEQPMKHLLILTCKLRCRLAFVVRSHIGIQLLFGINHRVVVIKKPNAMTM